MPRLRERLLRAVPDVDELSLLIGCASREHGGTWTDEQLAVAWSVHGERLMAQWQIPGRRPWGWWRFVLAEDAPREPIGPGMTGLNLEAVRLAELGELTRDELVALEERANEARARVGTKAERLSGGYGGGLVSTDARAVDLWEAVRCAAQVRTERT